VLEDRGAIQLSDGFYNGFNISWSAPKMPLQNFEIPSNVQYNIIVTIDPKATLDSVCLMHSGVIEHNGYSHFITTDNSFSFNNGKPGQSYFLNVVA